MEDLTFNTLWQNITAALVALGVHAASVNRLKTASIDPDVETHYRGLLKEWKEDEDNIKDQLDRMEGILIPFILSMFCCVFFCGAK